jgi:hypothetical protein
MQAGVGLLAVNGLPLMQSDAMRINRCNCGAQRTSYAVLFVNLTQQGGAGLYAGAGAASPVR